MTSLDAAAPPRMSRRQVLEALSGLLLGMFVSMIASTVISTSLPVIVHDLGGDQTAFTWVVTAMLLTTAIATPIWGKLADLTNRKVLFQVAIVLFVAATAAAGFAQDATMLIVFRAIQGVGAGGLAALSQVIMADIISPRERGRYMGLFGAVMAIATVGGPLLGGLITDAWGWRWNFFVSLPFAVVALFLVQRTLHIPARARTKTRIDYLGIVLLSTAVTLLLIWVTYAGKNYDWWSLETALMVGGALLAAVLFVVVELRSREPLIPLSMFRDRTFTLSVIGSIATGIAMFGASVFLSQYMQLARGATPTQAGIMTIPMIAGLLISSIVVGGLITKYGHWKPYLLVGAVFLIAGSSLLSTLHYDTDFLLVSLYMLLLGAGVGMTMQNLVLVVQNTAKPTEIGVASSGVAFFRSLGGTVGVSVMGAALATRVTELVTEKKDDITAAVASLGDQAAHWAQQLQSGSLPQVASMPDALRVIFEDVYAQGISHSFLIAVPFAVITLLAIVFLPNTPLTHMTASERRDAGEADMATLSSPQAMDSLSPRATASAERAAGSPVTDERTATRIEAIRGLEIEFGELIARFRRIIAENAQLVSPGMLPGAYKVFTTIARRGPVTSAVLREQLLIDKGQLSRTVRELEQLGLIARGEDPDDRRSIILSPTEEGLRRLTAARETQAGGLMSLIDDWPIERIHLLAELLHDLAGRVGRRP